LKPWIVAWLVRHDLPGWLVPDYFKLAGIAALLGSVIALRLAARDGASQAHTARAIACAYVSALAGGYLFEAARALPVALASWSWQPIVHSGRAAYGGLLAGMVAAWVYLRITRQPIIQFFDRAAIGAGLTFALVRTGCFLAGCDYGVSTAGAWGMRFPPGSLAALDHARRGFIRSGAPSLPVHPTQLYEAALGLLAAACAAVPIVRGRRDGRAFAIFLGVYASGRFAIEFLRGDQERGRALGLSSAQWVSVTILMALVFRGKSGGRSGADGAAGSRGSATSAGSPGCSCHVNGGTHRGETAQQRGSWERSPSAASRV
jgi:phosphatidylglycerol:prolipoprotein diacylglycerol transferase